MVPTECKVLELPRSAAAKLAAIAAQTPAFQAIIDRLPAGPVLLRVRCEQRMAQLLHRALYSPRLSARMAAVVLDHGAPPDMIAEEELRRLAADPSTCRVYDLWREVWADEDDIEVRGAARYYAGLLARLYRLEYQARKEADAI